MKWAWTLPAMALLLGGCSTVKEWVTGDDATEPPAELTEYVPTLRVTSLWRRDVGAGQKDPDLKLVPAVHGDQIFAASRDGKVNAYRAGDGSPLWRTDTKARISGGPGVGDGLVLVGTSDAEVLALSQADGSLRWRAPVSSEVLAPPAAGNGVSVVRTLDGKVFGLDNDTGERLWVYDRSVPVLTLRGTGAPVIAGDLVLNGFDGGQVVAVKLKTGQPAWEKKVTVPHGRSELERMVDIDADPRIMDDVVYVVTFQGRLAALDLFSGRILWRRDMSSHTGLAIDVTNIYVTDEGSDVWALDRYSSASVWRQTALHGRRLTAPAVVGDYVVVGDFEGYVHWLRRDTGDLAAREKVDGSGISAPPVALGDVLYVYGDSGKLAALRVTPVNK